MKKNLTSLMVIAGMLLFACNLYAQMPDEENEHPEKPLVVEFINRTLQAYRDSQIVMDEVLRILRELATAQVVDTNIQTINGILQNVKTYQITTGDGTNRIINVLQINPDMPVPAGLNIPGRDVQTGVGTVVDGDGTDLTWDEIVAMIEQNGGRVLRASENSMTVQGWRKLPEEVKKKVEKFAQKKGKKLKTVSPTVTGKLIKEDGQYYMDVYVWTGQGDPNNIHVYKEYWDSLSPEEKAEIEQQAKAYGGKVIVEDEKKRIKANLNTAPVEGAPSDEHLTQKEIEFLEEHVGEVITLHGWTVDGLINDGYTLEVVGLGKWKYEPYHPFDEIVLEESEPLGEEEINNQQQPQRVDPKTGIEGVYGILGR